MMQFLFGAGLAILALSLFLGGGDPARGFGQVFGGVLVVVFVVGVIVLLRDGSEMESKESKEREKKRIAEIQAHQAGMRQLQDEEMAKINAQEEYKKSQIQYNSELVNICKISLSLFEKMPHQLVEAERLLDQAEADFAEGVFVPFWDSIERATSQLRAFDESVREMHRNIERYAAIVPLYHNPPPQFPISPESVRGVAAGNTTSARLASIVRKAQGNRDFASIYEQRKTNQILVAGFSALAHALDEMGAQISASVDALGYEISAMSETVADSVARFQEQSRQGSEALHGGLEEVRDTIKDAAADQAERHDRALAMLIQRRRIPSTRNFGNGR